MMLLDTPTLRVAFSVVALTLLALFYCVTFRSTRSPYSGWWCVALSFFLTGSAAYLLDGTEHQWWGNPLGNCLLVTGAVSVWAGARSFRTAKVPVWQLVLIPAVTAVVSGFDNPATNVWSGGPVFLAGMFVFIGLASRELWHLEASSSRVHIPMAMAAGMTSVYYFGRWLAFITVGQHGTVFVRYFGSEVTTLITMVLLVVVSFTITALSNDQVTSDLKRQATHDDLTGVLNRSGFLDRAADELRCMRRTGTVGSVILADLDHFKAINDTYGHHAGDAAIQAFAAACTSTVRSTDLVARYGGEEFILLLPGAKPADAEQLAHEVSRRLRAADHQHDLHLPTVSYGIAAVGADTTDLQHAIASADAALYRAKSLGRDRAVHATAA